MSARWVRTLGQAVTVVSAGLIVFATLSPSVSSGGIRDEVAHVLLFFPLGLGGALWMERLDAPSQPRAALVIFAVVLTFAALTEIGQALVGRTPAFSDFMADAAGAGLGVLVGGWIAPRIARDPDQRD